MILARILYNVLLMICLAGISLLVYVLFLGDQAIQGADPVQFICVLALGATGLASTLTMISALAGRAGSGLGLMAVLGFPVVLPMLLIIIRASASAIQGFDWSVTGKYLLWMGILDVLVIALSYILFPYLWRD